MSVDTAPRPLPLRIDDHLVRIEFGDHTAGFVEEVGRVYVALAGVHYDRSVEVGQALSLERAIDLVIAA